MPGELVILNEQLQIEFSYYSCYGEAIDIVYKYARNNENIY